LPLALRGEGTTQVWRDVSRRLPRMNLTPETFSAGDHDMFIGRVDALATEPTDAEPLRYYRRRYLRIERATSTRVEGKHDG
jgi:hypothetical protein